MTPTFAIDHLRDEESCVAALLDALKWDETRSRRVEAEAASLIESIRNQKGDPGEIETFLSHYPLDSPEGLALMSLAEALLRIPDAATRDALIAEKMESGDWQGTGTGLMKLAGVGMGLAQKTLSSFLGRLGRPVVRKGMEEAVRRIGKQFVIGETITEALQNAGALEKKGYLLSYDMLGEGARTAEDAARYFAAYLDAARKIGSSVADRSLPPHQKPGMSVKLSALDPRYCWSQRRTCLPSLIEKLTQLCGLAASYNIPLTIDAEEADRLELSWEIVTVLASLPDLKSWDGLGMAVQAYDKRAFRLLDDLAALCRNEGRRMQIRLVKGAYWDTEIKRAQIAGLADYPVFTRKANTDLSYLACARKLMEEREIFYPMFASHNATTVAAILDLAGDRRGGFEFQRLYGMGGALHDRVVAAESPVRVYAPTGSYGDLLPYLVRRMLENGANSSFVNKVRGNTEILSLTADPVAKAAFNTPKRQPALPLPCDLYGTGRRNSAGIDLSAAAQRDALLGAIPGLLHSAQKPVTPVIGGDWPLKSGSPQSHFCPGLNGERIADVWDTTADLIDRAFATAREGFLQWAATPAATRAACLRRLGDLLEGQTPLFVGLLQQEAGKTLSDALAEIREAIDFCRYYAEEGEALFGGGEVMPGPTGEENILTLAGRGVFVCISPWNFPLAIFLGQIVAALMAGNSVIAKPAEQTPVIAFEAVRLILSAGVPADVITLLPGDGRIGAALVAHAGTDGVAFTGSTEAARLINRALAAKEQAIVPLIAETGGQNAMIVDSSALPEQVVDDVLTSAFGSAGQRCSALRVLFLQHEIADRVLTLLRGAMQELKVGNPRDQATDIGPVIDAEALKLLQDHKARLQDFGRLIGETPLPEDLNGFYFAPCAYEIDSLSRLSREVFGPILHVIRYAAGERESVIAAINASGYGLTFGLHSRLPGEAEKTAGRIAAGNIYINRSMIGAVVGVQPFGGRGLSGTGPKAGGPYYLHRFATEKLVSTNTTATGGNIGLLTGLEE